jgi:tetratricopeptide (TPR) repeat protein
MRTKMSLIAAIIMVFCVLFSQAKGLENKNDMKPKIDKIAVALMQTAANQFMDKMDCAGAETCLKVYNLNNQLYKEYLIKAGVGFQRCGEKERTKKACALYLDKYGLDPRPAALLAAIEFGDKNYGRVIELLKQIRPQVSSQEQLCMMLAEAHYETGQYDETVALLSQQKNSKNRRAIELLALSSEKMGDYANAGTCYEKLLSQASNKKRPDYVFKIALLFEETNQKDKASRYYEKNIADYPADLRNYERLVQLHMQARNYAAAKTLLEKAVVLPAADPVLQKLLGKCFAAQGDRAAAAGWFKKYLSVKPTDSVAWCELGTVYYEQEHYSEAVEVLKNFCSPQPKNGEYHIILGTCYVKIGDLASAIAPFEAARTLNKYDVRALSQLAACYRMKHDTKNSAGVLRDWSIADPKNCQPKIELGDMYVWERKYREAIPVLESAFDLDSVNPKTNLSLARAYEKNGNEANRFLHLKKALAHGQTNADVLFEMGRYYSGHNQPQNAKPFFARAISLEPAGATAQFEYARVLKALGENDSSYEHFLAALQADPFNNVYIVQFAQAAYAAGKNEVALTHIKRAVTRDPTNTEILQWAGILYKECGSTDTAKQFLLKAITLNKACASCYKHLADIYLAGGEYDLAVKFYKQSLAVGSFSEGASISLGVSLMLTGDSDRARMMFEKTLSQNPKSEESLYRLCSVYLRCGMLDKAKETYRGHKNDRKSGWARLIEGEIAEAESRPNDALISYTVVSNLLPENPLGHAGAGRINLQINQYEKATENFGNALGRDPHNADFLLGMGKAYEGMGQNQAAFDLYAEVARKSPKTPGVFFLMARVLSKKNEHAQSVTTLLRGIDFYPKDADLHFGLGQEYWALSKFKEAVEAFKKSTNDKRDENRLTEAYKNIGDIYNFNIKEPGKAKEFYMKYVKIGGKDEKVIQLVNSGKS